MKFFRYSFFLFLAICLFLILPACSVFESPTPPPLSTPKVPPIADVDSAISRWETGNNQNYFVTVEETNSEYRRLFRVVVADGKIRAAQQLERGEDAWQSPAALDLEIAQNYTVDALLERIRKDALGLGSAPMDMTVIFDSLSGFPSVVETQALPTYSDDGKLQLNRKESYSLAVDVNVLIEDTVGLNKDPLLTLTRSGGPKAFCDVLRIFTDGSSVYTDDCRQTLLQLTPPSNKLEILNQFAASYTGIDETREISQAIYHLILHGTGTDTPDATSLEETWQLSEEMAELLSRPIGAGITLLYTKQNILAGFDMRMALAQPASLEVDQPLHDVLSSYGGEYLAYTDDRGVRWLNGITGESGIFFPNPSNEHYILRAWGGQGELILQRLGRDNAVMEWGWTSLDDPSWHPLALKAGAFACDSGVSSNPVAKELVFAAGGDCQTDTGLTLLNLEDGGIRKLVDSDAVAGGGAFDPAWSPDGNWIAFSLALMDTPENATRLFVVHPDGSELTTLTNNTMGEASHPVWSADGTRLYYALSNSDTGEDGIYVYNFATGASAFVLAAEGGYPISMSASDEFLAFWNEQGLNVFVLAFDQVFPVAPDDEFGTPDFAGWLDIRTNK